LKEYRQSSEIIWQKLETMSESEKDGSGKNTEVGVFKSKKKK